jgi:hypothetical protein
LKHVVFSVVIVLLVHEAWVGNPTTSPVSAETDSTSEDGNESVQIVQRFVNSLNVLLEKAHADQAPQAPDWRDLMTKIELTHVFDASVLMSDDPYDPNGLPSPPPPETALLPTDIRKAIDEGLVDMSVSGTGDRSSIKLKIANRRKDKWMLIGIPVGIQFRAQSANVQNMGIR